MASVFLGYSPQVMDIFNLRHLVPGEDIGVGSTTGNILSWPDLQEGEQYLVGTTQFGLHESFYTVETIQDVNALAGRWNDILYGKLRIYVATRKVSRETGE